MVAYLNWQEQIDVTNFVGRQTELSRKSLNETVKSFRLDQRPWLGVLEIDTTIPNRESMKVKVEFVNSGKTPALRERLMLETDCYPVGQKLQAKYRENTKDQGAIILPNQHFFSNSQESALCSEKHFELFKQGKATLTVLGTIWYNDEFTVRHTTDFCLYYLVSKTEAQKQPTRYVEPQVCDYHNRAD